MGCCLLEHGDIVSLAYALEETLHVAIHKDALEDRGFSAGPWLARFKRLVRRRAEETTQLSVDTESGETRQVSLGELMSQIAHCERGMKLVYVTDAAPTRANLGRIVALAREAHLLVIEAVFADAEIDRARQRQHLTARMAGELARTAHAARLLVFHHSPRYQRTPDLLRMEAQRVFMGRADVCRDGLQAD